jgi:glycosyltransferase involved in cell wall biosynthesis
MKPRLLVLTRLFWPEGSGGELATYLFIRRYLGKHFDVVVVSGTERPAPLGGCCRYVLWRALRSRFKPAEWVKAFAAARRIADLVRWVDVIYIPFFSLYPLAPAVKRLNPRAKVVFHVHTNQLLSYTSVVFYGVEPGLRGDLMVELYENRNAARAVVSGMLSELRRVYWLVLSYADLVVFVSRRQLELIRQFRLKLPIREAAVVYNPPPPVAVEKRLPGRPVFMYVGGESYIKGFHILLKALPSLVRSGIRVRLFGGYSRTVKHPLVEVYGRVPHEVLMRFHRESWGLLFPSVIEEPLPYAVVEAALAGTVPIASRAGGVPEILSGTVADRFMFRVGDAEGLVGRVEELVGLGVKDVMEIGEGVKGVVRRRLEESAGRLPKVFMEVLSDN